MKGVSSEWVTMSLELVELPRWTNAACSDAHWRVLRDPAAPQPSNLGHEPIRSAILKLSDGIAVRIVRLR